MNTIKSIMDALKRFWKRAHLNQIFLLIISLTILIGLGYFAWIASTTNVEALKQGLSQSTIIYDKDGDEASKISANRMEGVPIDHVPDYLQNAIIAIEDHRFHEHNGFDVKGIMRAFFSNLKAGRITAGGSTITQQLTKVALLSPERTYKRKLEEIFLAVKLEKTFTKDEILEMYMNQVFFGSGGWGVQNASKTYFGKDVSDITISEAAMLAGIINRPSALDPYKNMEASLHRRDIVLKQMEKYGMITKEQRDQALQEKIVLDNKGEDPLKGKYPYYVDAVLNEAINQYGLTQDEILTRGYKIYTQMDQNLQSTLENVYTNDALFPVSQDGTLAQSGAILLDPKTGGIRALVGGRGEHTFRGYNRATQLTAQPGSAIKPLAVYSPALEAGYTAYSILKDEESLTFDGYKPQNANHQYLGEVPMYQAIEDSLNVPAVWLLNEIGIEKGSDALKRFGLPVSKEDKNLSLALGGTKTGYSPKQMAEAYSTFANGGQRIQSHIITKIVGPTGKAEVEVHPKKTRVMDAFTAEQMTSMLLNVVESGTGKGAKIDGYEIAGKTGSTQLSFDSNGTKDQWFVGYTPNIVGAVWLGYDYTDQTHYLKGTSGDVVVPIFRSMMAGSLPYIESEKFSTKSINQHIEEKEKQDNRSIKEKLKDFDDKMTNEAEKWKDKLDQGKSKLKEMEEKLKRKLKQFQ
ncbi:penicillin-binding protein 1A [Lederbergia sp. NSJ-179]|uniref:transglycosylase domain-containing protein n=1 Tax=Lederbergia sp. NSJ-179 TaxID=2931402 RepID=UPI001FD36FF3|nr:penicillin-binding protein 1A [Lederbergia sp. NSJ-179]MCJ7840438.1 penicillin-binding protein 1A [Lederbergia sp. NSJ-179]